ncbi:BMP-binding endothelial regulator protein-like [Mytilus californianus]|uniref:BMP-binding endothelial regulator protein-like n=1 Tax=Mytilus californianus TaxID=6549 RepID=UPI002246CD82|nr:BMP-binding endothelial regulator protein-like [Mytilus californianus]
MLILTINYRNYRCFVISWILHILTFLFSPVRPQLVGTISLCENEGEDIYIEGITGPCIRCFCKNGEVRCEREVCQSLEGCYMILFDNPWQKNQCCEVCKRCQYQGKAFDSGQSWVEADDPCVTLHCRAGVITRSEMKCYTPCMDPVTTPGLCCGSCKGCNFQGKQLSDGESFTLNSDPCTKCLCQRGSIVCQKQACPVLNCPANVIYTPNGSCCAVCSGERRIFNLPGGRCFFQNKIYKTGQLFMPGNCTKCTCMEGTAICERESCPPLTCSLDRAFQPKDSCCKICPSKDPCEYKGTYKQDGQKWQPHICMSCYCDDGATRCRMENCKNTLWCPMGYKLQYVKEECCPRCIEVEGVCTVYGDPHYRTFDGKIFNFQGPCKYLLAEDESGKSFAIRVRNEARTSPWFTWTKMLSIFISGHKVGLHQKRVVKVNRKRVRLPFTKLPHFKLFREGQSIVFQSNIGLKVVWDGHSYVEVTVASRYRTKMAGLCGNYNGNADDDMRGRDQKVYKNSEEFGDTWRVGSRAACAIVDKQETQLPSCDTEKHALKRAKTECSTILGSMFTKCRRRVDVGPYYRSCITDMCDCPQDQVCACESFKAYAHACSRFGISTKWDEEIICPHQCPEGARFKKCTKKCERTCDNSYSRRKICRDTCAPECLCPKGQVLLNKKCVMKRDCPTR